MIAVPQTVLCEAADSDVAELEALLADTQHILENRSRTAEAVSLLARGLKAIKQRALPSKWNDLVGVARSHILREILHQDPLSWRAYTQPRGYQGDAQLLDVIYRRDFSEVWPGTVTALGRDLFDYTIECKAPSSVRDRRILLANTLDEVAQSCKAPSIMSVACGHLRELEDSQALQSGRVGRFVGLDQDPDSVQFVNSQFGSLGVKGIHGSIKLLFGGPLVRERFDFIYAAGLFDYLDDHLAQKVTTCMFSMLNTRGRLLVANYLPDIDDVGYMETYMGWRLLYRNPSDMEALSLGLAFDELGSVKTFKDHNENIVYLELIRA